MTDPRDVLRWSKGYHHRLRIADRRTQHLTPYTPNPIQAELDKHIKPDKPVRLVILKARRFGVSTHLQMRFAHRAFTTRAFHGITGAHEDVASAYLHRMVETAYANLEPALRPAKQVGITGKRLELTHGSSLRTFTAGGREGVGRATAATALHGSEVAYWPDAKSTLLAILQIIPNEPGTIVALESTANGVGNDFKERWDSAVNGSSDYQAVFFPWYAFPDYARDPHDFDDADDRELALRARGVTDDQLAWRRWAIANLCGGDQGLFDQEYPDSPAVAFLTSGRPYFDPADIARLHVSDPIRIGMLEGDPVRLGGKLKFSDNTHGMLRIWRTPKPGRDYIIGADAAGGVSLDEHDRRKQGEKLDYACAQVIDRQTGEQVASLHGHIDADVFGVELARLGYLYNEALVAVENQGGYGLAPLAALKSVGYPRLYQRVELDTHSGEWRETLGWATTQTTRPLLTSNLAAWLRDRPDAIHDSAFQSEARTFVHRRNGQPGADQGCHDDRIMSLGIALEVRREAEPVRVGQHKPRRQKAPVFAAGAAA